jgi:hypothetical protein
LSTKEAEAAKLAAELDERSLFADKQTKELVALKAYVGALKERLDEAESECMRRTNVAPPIGSNLIQRFSK